jgi:6-phosphogluconolactonase
VTDATITVFPDPDALARAGAERVRAACAEALDSRGVAHLALSGGSTPRALYRRLTDPKVSGGLDWGRVHLWLGDERCVPPDHPDSNYHMVTESLLTRLPAPGPMVHRVEAERSSVWVAAADYARALAQEVPSGDRGLPALDLVLLGLGTDGHTASLFPGTCILHDHRIVAAVYVPRLRAWRVSLTLPVLNASRQVLFLVSGAEKAEAVRQVLRGSADATALPAGRVRPAGTLEWYLDAAAAAGLGSG